MNYKDALASKDTEFIPGERADKCINCGRMWDDHDGWACPWIPGTTMNFPTEYSKVHADKRYLTQSMVDSILANATLPSICRQANCFCNKYTVGAGGAGGATGTAIPVGVPGLIGATGTTGPMPKVIVTEPEKDGSDWRDWSHNKKGDCDCGIPRQLCTYHKD